MKKFLYQLASLKLAVILLILCLLALAAGTIVESAKGTETAGRSVYYAFWFQILMGLVVANVVASVALHYPWGKRRIGFLMTHSSLVLILIGAAVSFFFKTEGQLALWEGESSTSFLAYKETGPGAVGVPHELPFAVKLHDFQIDTYQGTMRPAMFRSKVEVTDGASGTSFPYDVQMNHELSYRGWSLFQSSYKQEGGREMTVLSVARDPGQPIVFVGYVLLIAGMCTVLATRIAQARAVGAPGIGNGRASAAPVGRATAAAIALILAGSGTAAAATSDPDALRRLPVQHDGRVMPLDTLAREGVWKVTGYRSWNGMDPVATVLAWTLDPTNWADTPVVKIGSSELAVAAGWPPETTHASFLQLVRNPGVMNLISQARQDAEQEKPRHGVVQDAEKLEARLVWLKGFLDRESIRPIPDAANPNARWGVPEHLHGADDFAALLGGARPAGWLAPGAIERELAYNSVRPTRIAWWILAAALVASIVAWNRQKRWLDAVSLLGLAAGFGVMTWGIATRWAIAGRIPASNMYESLLFLGWGVGLFALIAFLAIRNRIVVANANAMALLTMALTDLLPIDAFVHPVPPVLSGTPWLAIHVPIIMISYSVLALGVVFAHMQIGVSIFAPRKTDLVAKMGELLYWYTHVGSILLIAGILTGSIWAASSWGRYWGWDPKEVWSLVAFLAYIAILHARFDRQIGSFGIAAWSIVAFQTILMTYLGVNFVLTAGLHSYGFGGSRIVNVMVLVALAEAAFLGAGYWARSRGRVLAI